MGKTKRTRFKLHCTFPEDNINSNDLTTDNSQTLKQTISKDSQTETQKKRMTKKEKILMRRTQFLQSIFEFFFEYLSNSSLLNFRFLVHFTF
jgi:hypothetical protein